MHAGLGIFPSFEDWRKALTRAGGETATAPDVVVARLACGDVRGVHSDGLCIYRGIPYALPPAGALRWHPPQPIPRWDGVRDARHPGPACVQPARRRGSIYAAPLAATGEDCLSLDIWSPQGARDLPVLVWIHGGSFIWGAGSEALYDGEALARRGAVVVSINYRLGVFGYLAHPHLSAESPAGVSGNYGLLDQIAALDWVKRNIADLGGDPDNVTIAGESAGALSVLYLMASPAARGLFAKAIAQSAYMISTPHLKVSRHGHEPAEAAGVRLADRLGAADLAALRAMDAQELADSSLKAGFEPGGTVDGQVLPDQLVDIFERGEQARVPLITGFNSGEARSLRFLVSELPQTVTEYEAEIRQRYGELADRFLALYPSAAIEESALACVRDALYGWTSVKLARCQAAAGAPCFLYYFDHSYPAAHAAGLDGFHACELPYVFGTADRTPPLWPPVPASEAEARLARALGDFWTSFAARGTPRAPEAPDWSVHASDGSYMHFGPRPRLAQDLLPGMFELVDDMVRARRAAGDVAWNWNVGVAAPRAGGQSGDE